MGAHARQSACWIFSPSLAPSTAFRAGLRHDGEGKSFACSLPCNAEPVLSPVEERGRGRGTAGTVPISSLATVLSGRGLLGRVLLGWVLLALPLQIPAQEPATLPDPLPATAAPAASDLAARAQGAYRAGFALQRERRTVEAIEAYRRALELDPFHPRAHYELGWSYWVLGRWEDVVRHWEIAAGLKLDEPVLPEYLQRAREQLEGKVEPLVRVPIGTRVEGPGPGGRGRLALELIARFQHYDPDPAHPADVFDRYVFSPKSVHLTGDGARAYVNALEGFSTLVYDAQRLVRRKVILHRFGEGEGGLFAGTEAGAAWAAFPAGGELEHPNRFSGKPVEFAETHGGRYLWISYYRRDTDRLGALPSAVAVVDTRREEIVRVIDTGPIPKYLAASPDGRWLAVVHWGDNTVGLIDIAAESPAGFRRAGLIVVEHRLRLDHGEDVDRDRYCGYCLRGAVFSADSRHLLVGRMGGGGIAVLDVAALRHVGTVHGMKPTPRQLVLSPDGETLYVGSNVAGYVSRYRTAGVIGAARNGRTHLAPLRETRTGVGTRTIVLSPAAGLLFAAVNNGSKVVALDAGSLEPLLEIPADSFPVGLAVSPDGTRLWVTSQGRKRRGGNSISIYSVSLKPEK